MTFLIFEIFNNRYFFNRRFSIIGLLKNLKVFIAVPNLYRVLVLSYAGLHFLIRHLIYLRRKCWILKFCRYKKFFCDVYRSVAKRQLGYPRSRCRQMIYASEIICVYYLYINITSSISNIEGAASWRLGRALKR